jgi:hypothetical protein
MMGLVESFSTWLKGTSLSWAAAGGYPWLWPASETLHFIGMTLLIGIVGLLDLRVLGFVKGLPIAPLNRLLPWGILGFFINLITGVIFFAGDPFQYIHNNVFWAKMAFIAIAGVNVGIFYLTDISRQVDEVGPGEDAPRSAKIIAAASLFLWFGVMYFGRMLPFLGGAF